MLRLHRSLASRIPLLIFLLGSGVTVVAVSVRFQNSLETLETSELRHTRVMGLNTASGIEAALRREDASAARAMVEGANNSRNLNFAVQVDESGVVCEASRRAFLGQPVTRLTGAEYHDWIAEAARRRRPAVILKREGDAVLGVFPVFLDTLDTRPDRPPSDILLLELDISELRVAALWNALAEGALVGGLLAALCLALWLHLRRSLIQPLERLGAFASELARGGALAKLDIEREDELGRLAQRLRDMAVKLEERGRHLHESRERYRELVESTSDWVWELDDAGHFAYASPAVETILGYRPEELLGQSITGQLRMEESEEFLAAICGETPVTLADAVHLDRGGTPVHLEHTVSPRLDGAGKLAGYRGIARNVTDRVVLEKDLHRAQKLEALGRLAGGVAHDINNVLTAILGNVELARMAHGSGMQEIDEIEQAANRATSLTCQLLAFSRKQILRKTTFQPAALLESMHAFLQRLVHERHEIELSLTAVGWVRMDESHFEQIALNLVLNARDAMPSGGKIEISVVDVDGDQGTSEIWLEVRDSGPGIALEDQQNIFDPFFTTKPVGEGSGLGLSTVQGIVQTLGGRIEIDSAPGRGARFRVAFNTVPAPTTVKAPNAPTQEIASGRAGLLFLCEDQAAVRESLARLLRNAGHTVHEAPDGVRAAEELRRRRARGEGIDLLITDVVMPGKNGGELARDYLALFPGHGILFISGYTSVIYGVDEETFPEAGFLPKPFKAEELLDAVAELLARQRQPTGG